MGVAWPACVKQLLLHTIRAATNPTGMPDIIRRWLHGGPGHGGCYVFHEHALLTAQVWLTRRHVRLIGRSSA